VHPYKLGNIFVINILAVPNKIAINGTHFCSQG
jgi:hypothetical protein